MPNQLTLFQHQKQGDLPQPPSWLTNSIHKVIKHTPDVLVFRENKASNSPSCAYFFTGDMAGRSMEITPELEQAL